MPCSVEGCTKSVLVKKYGLCENHYRTMKRNGSPTAYINKPWGSAKTVRADGYIYITVNGKQVMEHRFQIERELGRELKADEVVHHKDGNRQNNELSNLEVMSWSAHSTLHGKQRTPERMAAMRAARK